MNTPKAIEIAIGTVIREFADLPQGVTIRTWQDLTSDATWDAAKDRTFPLIDIRCSPPKTDETQATLAADCAILIGTMASDDKSHAVISQIYEETQAVLDRLFSQFRRNVSEDENELGRFLGLMEENTDEGAFQFGGFTFSGSLTAYEDGNANMMGITLTVHYGRADF